MKYSAALLAALAAATVSAAPTAKRDANLNGKTVATWWGQSTHELTEVCDNANFDIVILSFLTHLDSPALNLAAHTGQPSAAQKKKGWNGLFDGTVTPSGGKSVATQIKYCQSKGKKVMLSFGGDATMSDATFKSADAAKTGAENVWQLFLGGTSMQDLRPFGKDVTLDGLDLDNESGNGRYYSDFVGALKGKFGGKKYLLSAAPMASQVGVTDETKTSIPGNVIGQLDFVNVQFYNDDVRGIGYPGFKGAAQAWAKQISAANKNTKMMVAMPGSVKAATGAGLSNQTPDQIKQTIGYVKSWNLPGFGGAAIWDAGYSMDNAGFDAAVKGSL